MVDAASGKVKQTAVGTCWQYQIGVDSGKEVIMDNLRVQTPGAKYCHFPKRDDYGSGYFTGLLSEVKVYDPNKKQPWQTICRRKVYKKRGNGISKFMLRICRLKILLHRRNGEDHRHEQQVSAFLRQAVFPTHAC